MRRPHLLAAGLAVSDLLPRLGRAQSSGWPGRGPIRLVAQFPLGGLVGTISRLVAATCPRRLARSSAVENRVGAGGVIGTNFAAESPEKLLTWPRILLPLGAGFVALMREDTATWTGIARRFDIVAS